MEIIVISIGALSKHSLWNERLPVRTSHATTTLIRTNSLTDKEPPVLLLIDPSLPGQILDARLDERAGIKADAITHIFLTNWKPVHRRGLQHFPHAIWFMHEDEIHAASLALDAALEIAESKGEDPDQFITKERALLRRVKPAPDHLAENVDLFPLFGYTPGQSGLIISEPTRTTIIAGDAVPTAPHFLAGQVFQESWDLNKAKDSLAEMYEVADIIIPGHDNLFITPRAARRIKISAATVKKRPGTLTKDLR